MLQQVREVVKTSGATVFSGTMGSILRPRGRLLSELPGFAEAALQLIYDLRQRGLEASGLHTGCIGAFVLHDHVLVRDACNRGNVGLDLADYGLLYGI